MKALILVALAFACVGAEAAPRKPHVRPDDRQMTAAPAQGWPGPASWATPTPQPEERTNANGS